MKKTLLFIILVAYSALTMKSQTLSIDSTFTADGIIYPFTDVDTLYGLQLSGSVGLQTDTSLVRVILADSLGEEYMVYEAYPLICTQDSFAVEEVCDETCFLDCFEPYSLRVEIIGASIYIDEVIRIGEYAENLAQLQYESKLQADKTKSDTMNLRNKDFNMDWQAGQTNVTDMFYYQKKFMFGTKYNLLGFEYYIGGVFEFLGSRDYEKDTTGLAPYFDWRTRHDASDSNSRYYDGDTLGTGWHTPVKDQGDCGSCYIFGGYSVFEAITNLYFNKHIDLDLSEQQILSCGYISQGCSSMYAENVIPYNAAINDGIIPEDCFTYEATDTIDCDTCTEQHYRFSISDKIRLDGAFDISADSIKRSLINYGPLTLSTMISATENHTMALSGYYVDPRDSVNVWIFKNSWGLIPDYDSDYEHDNGFMLIRRNASKLNHIFTVETPVMIDDTINYNVNCEDKDKDGYYWWGTGQKPDSCPDCPDEPDCNDNDPMLGPYDSCFNCRCNYSFNVNDSIITGDPWWNDTIIVDRNMIIDSGSSLNITSVVKFIEHGKIIVKPGGELSINGGHLTKACNERWHGIEVWGNPDTTQNFEGLQGVVKVYGNTTIEYAETAILLGAKNQDDTYNYNYGGGIVYADSCLFLNNAVDVEFLPYKNMHPYSQETELSNLSYFHKCKFLTTNTYPKYYSPDKHVILKEVKGIDFLACWFEGAEKINSTFYTEPGRGFGIYSLGSSFNINSLCADMQSPCQNYDTTVFRNLKHGVLGISWSANDLITIDSASFENVEHCIQLSGVSNPRIVRNSMNILSIENVQTDTICGIYLSGCSGYQIEENNIFSNYDPNPITTNYLSYGIYINNSGPYENEVYKNTLHNLRYALSAEGVNKHDRDPIGLCIKCNNLYSNMHDILVFEDTLLPYNGIAPYQGSADTTDPTAPANNIFSISTLDKSDILNDGEFIVYYHPLEHYDLKVIPEHYDTVSVDLELNRQDFIGDTSCPSNLGGSRMDMETRYSSSNNNVQSITAELSNLLDGGDTEELNTDIQFSMPPEAMQLRQQLLNESPYLSDTVMKSAIEKENVLPNAMIRDVLVANPQSAKSGDVLGYLDTRFDPMPGYMMGQILSGRNTASAKENLEAKLQHNKIEKSKAVNELVRFYKSDSNIYAFDSTIYWLQQKNSLDAEYTRVFEYIDSGDTTTALNILADIPNNFDFNNLENQIHQKFTTYINIYKELFHLNGKVWQADSAQLAQLVVLSGYTNYMPEIYARNILIANGIVNYHERFQVPGQLKSLEAIVYPNENTPIDKNEFLRLFPNPAKNYVIVEYYNPILETKNDLYLFFVNNQGIITKSMTLEHMNNSKVINTNDLLPGIYVVSLVSDNELINAKKLIIYE